MPKFGLTDRPTIMDSIPPDDVLEASVLRIFWSALVVFGALALCLGCEGKSAAPAKEHVGPRIVTLGGDVTEIVYALGAGDSVVGADMSSTYPPEVTKLPRLNYHRQVSPEGIVSLDPDLVLLTAEAGPPGAIAQLRSAAKVVDIPNDLTAEGVAPKMRAVALALDRVDAGEQLVATYEKEMADLKEYVDGLEERPSVLFLYARQGMGAPMVGGTGSGADTMIELAGGVNAAAALEGFKPLTPEALLEFNPACVLMMTKGLEAVGGEAGLLGIPGMADTKAGQSKNFVAMPDDLLLTFGPRTPQAIRQLATALHGEEAAKK
ncbi:ABC transporter substrate-binding protein [bacterium]|nr:ABC transporter substrate-binding protein [bacterium]